MKILLLLVLGAVLLGLGGCASDPEDRAFYEQHWLHPSERDGH